MPRQLLDAYGRVKQLTTITPIARGGTAADNAAQAVENLQGVNRNKIDAPFGVAGADQNGYLLKKYLDDAGIYSGITLEGPTTLVKSNQNYTFRPLFFISNFHTQLPPVVTSENIAVQDSLEINFPFFSFETPITGNSLTLTINGKDYVFPLIDNGIETPKLIGISDKMPESFFLQASKFRSLGGSNIHDINAWLTIPQGESSLLIDSAMNSILIKGRVGSAGIIRFSDGYDAISFSKSQAQMLISPEKNVVLDFLVQSDEEVKYGVMNNTLPHVLTEWEVSTNALFTQIVISRSVSAGDLLSTSVNLAEGLYYARCRYRSASLYSNWSQIKSFTVDAELNAMNELGIIIDQSTSHMALFGSSVCTQGDLVAIGAPGMSEVLSDAGSVTLYKRAGFVHQYLDTILPPSDLISSGFGMGVSLSKTDDLFIGSPGMANGGAVYQYSGDKKALVTAFQPPANSVSFGFSVKVTETCLIVGDPRNNTNGENSGAVHIYKKTLAGYVFSETVYPTTPAPNDYFGISVTATDDGSHLFIGSTSPLLTDSIVGKIYVFTNTNEHYSESEIRNSPMPLAGVRFTRSMDYCQKTNLLYVGCEGDNTKGSSAGAIYRFTCDLTPGNIEITYIDTITPIAGDVQLCFGTGIAVSDNGNQLYAGVSRYKLNSVTIGGVFFFS